MILAIGLGVLFWKNAQSAVDPNNTVQESFVIPQGWSAIDIGKSLKKNNFIKNSFVFRIFIQKKQLSNKLQAGTFQLSKSMTLEQILNQLTSATDDVWVTIPEGLRREEIVSRISQTFQQNSSSFEEQDFLEKTERLEGFLFPDTYLIPKNASASAVVSIFLDNFQQKYNSLNNQTDLSQQQLVTLASLIEREAKYQKDRYLVSGILLKRLQEDWALQVDATVQYAKANQLLNTDYQSADINWWPQATSSDLKNIQSPYNTYENKGLPPTPICNPGLDSLKAASNPKKSSYWFYLSEPSGKTHYAETLEEHQKNIDLFLK